MTDLAPATPALDRPQGDVPRPEYPRPDRDRSDRWLNLNGTWSLDTPAGSTSITVPFAWETLASGVARTWLEHATYRRTVTVPAGWAGARVVLCFGAVHHRARVLVDGFEVGTHVGGYDPFELDLTDVVEPGTESTLEVEVEAPADKRGIPHGKQRSIPRDDYDGVSFRPTSGIWQTVWLEARGRTYVDEVRLRGESLVGFDLSGTLRGDAPAGAVVHARIVGGSSTGEHVSLVADADGRFAGRLEPADPRTWGPADPHLYQVELTVGAGAGTDRVVVTGGLRCVEVRGEQIFLNGERLYVRGVLDQGYWPETGLTAPDDDALLRDLEIAAGAGYNLVRKHVKLEEPRWLHHADRVGMLVWAEPPGPSRFCGAAADAFEAQLAPMAARDGNHPSIVIWGLYNEEWGLDWDISGSPERAAAAARAYDTLRALDATRPIVENSGWSHVRTDLVDWHYYDEDPAAWATNVAGLADGTRETFPVKLGPNFVVDKSLYGTTDQPRTGVPILNSEYGAGFTSLERAWSMRWQTQELRRHDRFAGYVYTELADVEQEMAGIVDSDRRAKDMGGLDPADVNAETTIVVDLVPRHAGADIAVPDGPLTLGIHVSHHGRAPVAGHLRAAWVSAGTPFRETEFRAEIESEAVEAEPFVLTPVVTLRVPTPGAVSAARLHLWFVDESGETLARTFVDAGPIEPPNRRGART
ncbi:hypothetical protein MF406_17710 [Georgenia sp. TF02-10]|uniref:glycoside hydrolase family 2 protein n=1 Tax=Georgenia sp. TF02-10 TaxID=2917725 RepID=UPI001FA6F30A|nr:glycoside hydrolase family 2 TIM barrel-domain containing protein [Georgenia sp. TF02-10]UNX54685.1 hypothetical protein MF406_17710 [Georgenia sp. TF02-10]